MPSIFLSVHSIAQDKMQRKCQRNRQDCRNLLRMVGSLTQPLVDFVGIARKFITCNENLSINPTHSIFFIDSFNPPGLSLTEIRSWQNSQKYPPPPTHTHWQIYIFSPETRPRFSEALECYGSSHMDPIFQDYPLRGETSPGSLIKYLKGDCFVLFYITGNAEMYSISETKPRVRAARLRRGSRRSLPAFLHRSFMAVVKLWFG